MGSASAKVTLVEVSDYHCPFCRRHTQQVFPQIQKDYVDTGKIRYVFIDYPIAQLHPDAHKAHEAANCAGEQGKFWEMHRSLFANPPARDAAQFTAQARAIGADVAKFSACLTGGKYGAPVRETVEQIQGLGIGGTPTTLVGITPSPGAPMKIAKVVVGAQPYQSFRTAIDAILSDAK
jgi:protein-disulfide isomerase